jgi:hypothetical protein
MTRPVPVPENTYPLDHWLSWPDEVHMFVQDYVSRHEAFPNALVASSATLRRMDMAADRAHVHSQDGGDPDAHAYTVLGGIRAHDYELTFLINDEVPDRHVWLLVDGTDGDGDGERVPDLIQAVA